MSVITITASDVAAYTGMRTPATARLYANEQFTDSTSVIVAEGSKLRPVFYQSFTASLVSGNIRIASGTAYSTTNSTDNPSATYTLVIYDTAGREMYTVGTNISIPTTTPTTWAAILVSSAAAVVPLDERFYNKPETDALFTEYGATSAPVASEVTLGKSRLSVAAAVLADPVVLGANDTAGVIALVPDASTSTKGKTKLSIAPASSTNPIALGANDDTTVNSLVNKASTSVEGKTKISFAPAVANTPIAVSENDPYWVGLKKSVYLGSYAHTQAGLASALTAIGSTQKDLVITEQVPITSSTSTPANVNIRFEGDGSFTVASSQTLTIGAMAPVGRKQIFFGSGSVVFAENATGGKFRVEWWAGLATSSDLSSYLTQWTTSLTTSKGGILEFGAGNWFLTNFTLPSNTILRGVGCSDVANEGTVLKLFATGGTNPVIRIGESLRNTVVEDMTLDNNASTTANVVLCEGAYPNSTIGVYFKNVVFKSSGTSTRAFKVNSTSSDWECFNISFAGCKWQIGTSAYGIDCNSVNTSFYLDEGCSFYCGSQAVAIHGASGGMGYIVSDHTDFRGPGAASPTSADERPITASVAAGSNGALAVTAGALTISDLGQRIVRGSIDTYINSITSSTTGTVAAGGAGAAAGTATVYRYTPATSMPKAVIWLEGPHTGVNIRGAADEGYQYFLINDGSELNYPINIEGVNIQSPIQLNQSCVLNIWGCQLSSGTINDGASASAHITIVGSRITTATHFGNTLTAPQPLGVHSGSSQIMSQSLSQQGSIARNRIDGHGIEFVHGGEFISSGAQVTIPVLTIASSSAADGSNTKPQLRVGYADPVTGLATIYYDIYRSAVDGWLNFAGNQADPFKGYVFNAAAKGTGFLGTSNSVGLGYTTGAGASVSQATSRTTGVTLNAVTGSIQLVSAAGSATPATFTVTNSVVSATDVPLVVQKSGTDDYIIEVTAVASGSFDITFYTTGGTTTEQPVFNFALLKGVTS